MYANSLGNYCAGKLNISWHGVKVRTEKSNGKNIIKLSTSLLGLGDEESFEIDAQRQLFIHFGNENDFSAYVTVDGGEPFEIADDKAKLKAFTELAPKGAHLKDFVGFWTLGLDMLPWMDHEVELFINRSCGCSMEAWFIRPTDGMPNDPKEPSTGIGGPKAKCIVNTTKEVPLSLKANHLIRIQMLIDGNAKNNSISFAILSGKSALMTFKMSSGQNGTIQMNGSDEKNMPAAYLPKKNGTRYADFIIALTNYSYGIVMNGVLLGDKEFFPANWWAGLPFNDMTSLRLSGQFLLLTDPLVMPFDMFGQQNYVPQEQKASYTERIPNLQQGANVTFRVKLHSNNDTFVIYFLHNRISSSKAGDSIGAAVEILVVEPKLIGLYAYYDGDLVTYGNILLDNNNTLKAKNAYEFVIVVLSDKYEIRLNNNLLELYKEQDSEKASDQDSDQDSEKAREQDREQDSEQDREQDSEQDSEQAREQDNAKLPFWATNFVAIDGNVTLLAKPEVVPPKKSNLTFSNFTIQLKTLLDYNDTIQLKLENQGENFSILLLHDALKANNIIGDVVLKMTFEFNGYNCSLSCQYLLSAETEKKDKNASAKDNYRELTASVDGRLNKYGQEFDMDITASEDNFTISIQEVNLTHSCPYPKSNDSAIRYPPWAVDYIRFEDDVQVHAMNIMHPPTSRRNMKQINDTKNLVQAGDLITVKLAIKDLNDNSSVAINLFHEALELHNKVGKTVMKVMLNSTAIYFSSFKPINGSNLRPGWKEKEACIKGKLDKELKELEIRVMDDGFNVTLTLNNDSSTTCIYKNGLPKWAVQYITFEHNDVTLSNPPSITCAPKERCNGPKNRKEQYHIEKDSIQI
uniref:Galectin domain-containing protein n=1 Tax=Globodera rostochiensis TaxID=31243 RepID=A0A914HBY4_GLORO